MRKLKGIMLGVVAASLVLAGACSNGNNAANKETGASPGSSSPAAGTAGATQSSDKEKLTLKFFVDGAATSNLPKDESKDFVRKTIEEKFNVDLEVTYMPVGDTYQGKINALIAANDPPDMWRDSTGDGGNQYAIDGVLADMTPFVNTQTMPNYFKYWMNENELKGYQVQNGFFRAPLPYELNLYYVYYIRKDWLDKLNLEVPDTYEKYVDVLRAFRNNDPDGNGKKDTYGFTASAGGNGITLDWPEYQKNGLIFLLTSRDNHLVDMQTDLNFGQVVDDIVKLINEDLIDPDWYLSEYPAHIDRAAQGKAGVILGMGKTFAWESDPQSLQSKAKLLNADAEWVAFNPFGQAPLAVNNWPGNPFLFPKNTAEQEPEKIARAVEILDWLGGEEGFILTHYGLEDRHYTREGNTITLNNDAFKADVLDNGNFLDIWDFFTPDTPENLGLEVINPAITDKDREILQTILDIPVLPNIGANIVPPEGFDLGTFRKKQRELQTKLLFEEKSGANWPKYREQLMTEYGGQKLLEEYERQIRGWGFIE